MPSKPQAGFSPPTPPSGKIAPRGRGGAAHPGRFTMPRAHRRREGTCTQCYGAQAHTGAPSRGPAPNAVHRAYQGSPAPAAVVSHRGGGFAGIKRPGQPSLSGGYRPRAGSPSPVQAHFRMGLDCTGFGPPRGASAVRGEAADRGRGLGGVRGVPVGVRAREAARWLAAGGAQRAPPTPAYAVPANPSTWTSIVCLLGRDAIEATSRIFSPPPLEAIAQRERGEAAYPGRARDFTANRGGQRDGRPAHARATSVQMGNDGSRKQGRRAGSEPASDLRWTPLRDAPERCKGSDPWR